MAESASLARAAGDTRLAVNALSNLAWAYQVLGDHARSVAASEDAIAVARSAGDDWALALALNNHADQYCMRGDFRPARPLLEESLDLRRRGGEPRAISLTAANLAQITLGEGDLNTTDALLKEALGHARAINYQPMIVTLAAVGALSSLHRGDAVIAHARLSDAGDFLAADVDLESGAVFLSAAAALAAVGNDSLRAAKLWAAADRALAVLNRAETPGSTALRARWLPHAQSVAHDVASWDAAWETGAALSLNDALALARGARDDPQAQLPTSRAG